MLTVSRQCHTRLMVAVWVLYIISIIAIIAGASTNTWLVQISTGNSHGLTDCCSSFCSTWRINVKDDVDATLGIGLFGFLVSVAGIIVSLLIMICSRQLTYKRCIISATLILVGGLLMIVAVIVYAARVPGHINSIITADCFKDMRVDLGASFGAYSAGSVGVLLAALPLFFTVPRFRLPLMVGDFVSVDTPGTAAGAALPQSQAQTAESGVATNVENVELSRLRPVGSRAQPGVNHSFDFWDGLRVAPSAPNFDLLEAPEPFHSISEQPQLHSPIPEPIEIPYEAAEISSVSERPTLHRPIPEPPEPEYETLDEMSSYINTVNQATPGSAVLAHSATLRQKSEFSTANCDLSDDYCLAEQPGSERLTSEQPGSEGLTSEQPGSERLTSEQPDEYANIEETIAEFARSSQSGALYANLDHPDELIESEYNNIEQSEPSSCTLEHPVTVIAEVEYVSVE